MVTSDLERAFYETPEMFWPAHRADLAGRIRTGCLYEAQPDGTLGVLVTRDDPRTRYRGRRVLAPIHAHWATFAPSVFLLTGHETACRARRCRGDGRCAGHTPLRLGWPTFAAAYHAELERWPFLTRLALARQVAGGLCTAPTVTILSFEPARRIPPSGAANAWAQRHVFRDWLVSLLPLAMPLGVVHLRTAQGREDWDWVPRGGVLGHRA